MSASLMDCANSSRVIEPLGALIAILIPLSRVRSATEYESTP